MRHDIDGEKKKIILLFWKWQNSSIWIDFLQLLSWVYVLMTFFEPANRLDAQLPDDAM